MRTCILLWPQTRVLLSFLLLLVLCEVAVFLFSFFNSLSLFFLSLSLGYLLLECKEAGGKYSRSPLAVTPSVIGFACETQRAAMNNWCVLCSQSLDTQGEKRGKQKLLPSDTEGNKGGKKEGRGGEGFGERKNVIEKRERWEGWRETQSKSFKIAPQ